MFSLALITTVTACSASEPAAPPSAAAEIESVVRTGVEALASGDDAAFRATNCSAKRPEPSDVPDGPVEAFLRGARLDSVEITDLDEANGRATVKARVHHTDNPSETFDNILKLVREDGRWLVC